MLKSARRTNISIVLLIRGDNMLLKLYIVSIITCNIPLLFYLRRLKKLVFKSHTLIELIISYFILSIPGFIPFFNIVLGYSWIVNTFVISDNEFIEGHIEE